QEQPEANNDEIRRHLALDQMVVVDLGGFRPEDPPNPNVMYELGIRHAFSLPLVLLAWETQQLPFDISNQRAIMGGREMLDIEPTRMKIVAFINAAKAGRYYNPMEAVGRHARLDSAAKNLSEDSVLKTLIDEIKDIKANVAIQPGLQSRPPRPRVTDYLRKSAKKKIRQALLEKGLPEPLWDKLLLEEIPFEFGAHARFWETDSWVTYLWMLG